MSVDVLNAATDGDSWDDMLSRVPKEQQDIYFSSGYVGLHRFAPETEALLFAFTRHEHVWLYPFLRQRITSIGSKKFGDHAWYDIESAYGYGGPLATSRDENFLAEAHASFTQWAADNGVVAEFVRLHPFLENEAWLARETEIIHDRDTVSVNLSNVASKTIQFGSDARYMIRRAESAGVTVNSYSPSTHFERFVALYTKAMQRIQAGDYYFFNDDYFEALKQLVERRGWLLVAEQEGTWVAAALFLKGGEYMHYHLSATDPDRKLPGATNAIIAAAAHIGTEAGLKRLHLGGGRTANPDDALLKFKESMATDRHHFQIGKRVRNPGAYSELCRIWREEYPSLVPIFGNRFLCYKEKPAISGVIS
jgi:GNAT acetyltransferase-like protein